MPQGNAYLLAYNAALTAGWCTRALTDHSWWSLAQQDYTTSTSLNCLLPLATQELCALPHSAGGCRGGVVQGGIRGARPPAGGRRFRPALFCVLRCSVLTCGLCRAALESLTFSDKVPGAQATNGPLKVAQTAAVLEVGSLPALCAAEWLRAR